MQERVFRDFSFQYNTLLGIFKRISSEISVSGPIFGQNPSYYITIFYIIGNICKKNNPPQEYAAGRGFF
ncbi:MAG TPA: hypothetical protein DEO40_02080 [Treponema sp.]|nr:hypothetical protein [Treponema sp.]HBB43217.1 hypothetical protein [Treponema sp.]HCA19449.1 hypothetical protein [Treponema sp.]